MSTGHREEQETLQGKQDYREASRDRQFLKVLQRGCTVSAHYDIPYVGGYSEDGRVLYIDKDFALARIHYADGPLGMVSMSPARFVVAHENWEKTAMMVYGWRYLRAHDLATIAEDAAVQEATGGKLQGPVYERLLRPLIEAAERKMAGSPERPVFKGGVLRVKSRVVLPPDLDYTPYLA